MARYARGTDVSADRSRAEIERTLRRYGATTFTYGWDEEDDSGRTQAMVGFRMHGRVIRMLIPMPSPFDDEFATTPTRRTRRSDDARLRLWEQACRERWRSLALVVKAKLEAIDAEIATFDEEFLPYIVLPDGRTVGDLALPEVERSYELGKAPRLLLTS